MPMWHVQNFLAGRGLGMTFFLWRHGYTEPPPPPREDRWPGSPYLALNAQREVSPTSSLPSFTFRQKLVLRSDPWCPENAMNLSATGPDAFGPLCADFFISQETTGCDLVATIKGAFGLREWKGTIPEI
jgi:hypothetical protein